MKLTKEDKYNIRRDIDGMSKEYGIDVATKEVKGDTWYQFIYNRIEKDSGEKVQLEFVEEKDRRTGPLSVRVLHTVKGLKAAYEFAEAIRNYHYLITSILKSKLASIGINIQD